MLAACTLFVSAFLLFFVQPMLGKALLPLIGGASDGWLSLLVFFQLVLLLGYALAFWLSRHSLRLQAGVVWGLLALGSLFLPPSFAEVRSLTSAPQVIGLLLATVGVPALALAMLSSTVQRVVAVSGRNPYLLYAASNAGSLLGLLLYPLAFELVWGLRQQQLFWAVGYVVLLALLGLLLWRTPQHTPQVGEKSSITNGQRLLWMALAALPASLSYGLVSYVTFELGGFALFWVVPLALYLLSYIIAFSGRGPSVLMLSRAALAAFAVAAGIAIWAQMGGFVSEKVMLPCWLLCFFLLATALHSRLALARPEPAALSEYYVWLALGGTLGGLFNVFAVPYLFAYPVEFFVVALAALYGLQARPRLMRVLRVILLPLLAVLLLLLFLTHYAPHRWAERNFFGPVLVFDAPDEAGYLTRFVSTGPGYQGAQRLVPVPQIAPELYFRYLQPLFAREYWPSVGMLGLGAGMALCFTGADRHFTVYEIDPKMRRIAEQKFSYIQSCGAPEWRMGDGRIELARDTDRRFDALIIDAFHGVNIPLHLVTREALALYRSRLKPGGVLLYNINSLYYTLYNQVGAQAREAGLQAWRAPSSWVALADPQTDLSWLKPLGWTPLQTPPTRVWTDDYASPLSALIH